MRPEELLMFIERELDSISAKADMDRLPSVIDSVIDARTKLNEKLKIAVVGKTKAGKSTLLNSLLGITKLPMGDGIVTGNVSVLMHTNENPTKEETVVVHLTDKTTIKITLEQYRELVDISKKDSLNIRDRIVWFDVYLKHQALLDMSIIDTPGDDSWLKYDSENAKKLFRDKNRKPDIIVYVVRKEFGSKDIEAAQDYLAQINGGEHRVSGLNVITVYSCCDELVTSDIDGCNWDIDYRVEGNRIIENNRAKSSAFRKCFSKCFPVSAIFSMAANAITESDLRILREISKSTLAEYFYRDFSYMEIASMDYMGKELKDIFESESAKDDMLKRLGLDSMKYIVWWCMANSSGTLATLKEELEKYSNVPALRKYLLDEHYRKLSTFYKATSVLSELKKNVEKQYIASVDIKTNDSLRSILETCRNLEKKIYNQYGFLGVLRDYYDCLDYFDDTDWNLAYETIMFCISSDGNKAEALNLYHQWKDKKDFYNMLGCNQFAIDASEKLINSIISY